MAEGIALLSIKLEQGGIDPETVTVSIPTETGVKLETEMLKSKGWRGVCDGISLWADGHRKQIDLSGIRVHWRSTPPAW